jgi:folate-dependent phosphoribosylglycinamide formyltransferase PurN
MGELHNPTCVIWGDGGGSTFRAVAEAVYENDVNFGIAGVVTTSEKAGILGHVAAMNELNMGITPLVVPGTDGRRQDEATQKRVLDFMQELGADSLILLGAMTIMGATLVEALNGDVPEEDYPKTLEGARALMVPREDGRGFDLPPEWPNLELDTGKYGLANTHPAPSIVTANTHGLGSQRRLVDIGSRQAGQMLHVVAKGIDTGPAIAFQKIDIGYTAPDASEKVKQAAAEKIFKEVQIWEKLRIHRQIETQLARRQQFLHPAA